LLAFIACIFFVVHFTKAIADDSKDYSWASELMEKREENREVKKVKRVELERLYKEIEAIDKENDLISCKLDK
jgi:hypothetical protein